MIRVKIPLGADNVMREVDVDFIDDKGVPIKICPSCDEKIPALVYYEAGCKKCDFSELDEM